MVTCVLFLLVLIIVQCEKVDVLYTYALLLTFTNSRLSSSSSSSSFDLDPLDVSKKSMDETMASLDDLLPAAAKPKREFPENFYDDDPGSEKQPSMKKPGQKGGNCSRKMAVATSRDFVNWSYPRTCFYPDERDVP